MKTLIILAAAALAHTSSALTLSLDMNFLPSAQGWTYSATGPSHGGQIETNIWNANGLRLAMNTIGSAFIAPSANIYVRSGEVGAADPIVIEWTSRMLQHEFTSHYGWCVGVTTDTQQAAVGFETDSIQLASASPVAFNTMGFHDYRIEFTPGAATFSLFVDGGLFSTAPATPITGNNRIFFGDASGASNGRAEMTEYTFTQVPEPTCAAMLAGGFALLGARRRRVTARG